MTSTNGTHQGSGHAGGYPVTDPPSLSRVLAAAASSALCETAGYLSLWSGSVSHRAAQVMTWAGKRRNRLRALTPPLLAQVTSAPPGYPCHHAALGCRPRHHGPGAYLIPDSFTGGTLVICAPCARADRAAELAPWLKADLIAVLAATEYPDVPILRAVVNR